MKKVILFLSGMLLCLTLSAHTLSTTLYTATQCEGSSMPYPTPPDNSLNYPDSLTPVFLNHVGRHGARFMSSSKFTDDIIKFLDKADSLECITQAGKELRVLCKEVISITDNQWGALDSLGKQEQRDIATRAYNKYKMLFNDRKIHSISSFVPRCVASMDEFTHQLTWLNNKIEIYSSSGRQNSYFLRPWDSDTAYKAFMKDDKWYQEYESYRNKTVPKSVAYRILGNEFPLTEHDAIDFSLNVYKLIAGCAAIGIPTGWERFLTLSEYNSLWSVVNMHHYLTHTASGISSVPAYLAVNLLTNLINTTQEAAEGRNEYSVLLRFGHAETLMPLLSLMRLPGCNYQSSDYNTVKTHWRDFQVVPMAANLQMILFKSTSGKYYLRVDLNENPVKLMPGESSVYIPWEAARNYLSELLDTDAD